VSEEEQLLECWNILREHYHRYEALSMQQVLDDGVLQQTWERFVKVMAPKVGMAPAHLSLRIYTWTFRSIFSVAALLGSPGQGNYAAANAF